MIRLKSLLYEIDDLGDEDRIVKSRAYKNGYIHQTYRGDVDAGNIFNYSIKERREYGIFTTQIMEIAAVYAGGRSSTPRKFYVRAPKILDLTQDTLQNMKWVQKWGESFDEWRDPQSGEEIDAWTVLEGGRMFDYEGDWSSERWMDIQATAHHQGYDAIILPDFDSKFGIFPSFVIFDEKNLKLADTTTYDDHNVLIPIELRFDKTSSDIRL
jgi:hypothetical protein